MIKASKTNELIGLRMAINPLDPPVSLALAALNVPHHLFRHCGPVSSLEQAATERNQSPEQVIRSILFRLDDEQYVMALVAGPGQIAWPALRRTLGVSRVSMATPAQVQTVTGYEIGAVAPFGLPTPLPILIDESVTSQDELSMGSGVRGTAIMLRRDDLLKALGDAPVVRLTAER
jgi:Cys-tRNA(Pro)/Cys-tRNA(Cys) deacylase